MSPADRRAALGRRQEFALLRFTRSTRGQVLELLAVRAAEPGRPTGSRGAALAGQRPLTESLGGTYHQLTRLADQEIPSALLVFAHARNATQLVLGAHRRGGLVALRPAATVRAHLIRRGSGIDVHAVSCAPTTDGALSVADGSIQLSTYF